MKFTINSPTTWLLAEILSVVLLFICVLHAAKQEEPGIRLMELAGFVLAAGLFENIGVSVNAYDYNLNRIFLFGKAPFAILFFEAVKENRHEQGLGHLLCSGGFAPLGPFHCRFSQYQNCLFPQYCAWRIAWSPLDILL